MNVPRRTLFLLALLAGCPKARPVQTSSFHEVTLTPWCVRLQVDGTGAVLACAETESKCQRGRGRIVRWGGMAGVTEASECEYAP